jgi:TrmH family RNA methyltransferase
MTSYAERGDAPPASAKSAVIADAADLLQGKHRRARGQFLIEGPQGVSEALNAHTNGKYARVSRVFIAVQAASDFAGIAAAASAADIPITWCDERGLGRLATARTPAGVVAMCTQSPSTLTSLSKHPQLLVYLYEAADPGNVGTIIRTADAAGADGVLLSPGSVDPFNDKCLRSTTGSIFHLPVVSSVTIEQAAQFAHDRGLRILAATAEGLPLTDSQISAIIDEPVMWIFGSEAHGIPSEAAAIADLSVAIPHYGAAESLNLATAAGICMYASAMAQRSRA